MKFEMPSCTGCKTCEMACSFKHTGEYRPNLAAISISQNEDGIGFSVSIDKEESDRENNCVGCLDCLEVCTASEDLRSIIIGYLRDKNKKSL